MISFEALSIGSAAAEELAARGISLRVHSVFPSAVNLAAGTTGRLLALTNRSGRIYPYAIALHESVDFTSFHMNGDSSVRFEANAIEIAGDGCSVGVDLNRASVQPRRSVPQIHKATHALDMCVKRLIAIQDAAHFALNFQGMSDVWPCRVSSLIGLGGGLTPSGDDFVCGFLAAVRACGWPELFEALSRDIQNNLALTGEVSSSMLRWMLLGYWPDPLLDLAEAIAAGFEREAMDALERLCDIGHSSGADIATGFLLGLTTWLEQGKFPHLTQRSSV